MPTQPTYDRFVGLCRRGAVVPLVRRLLSDALTPVEAYARLRAAFDRVYLLESVDVGERWGRYSVVAVGGPLRLRGVADPKGRLAIDVEGRDELAALGLEPVNGGAAGLAGILRSLAAPQGIRSEIPDLPRFYGGLVGAFSHDFVRTLERLPRPDGGRAVAFELAATRGAVVFDNLAQTLTLVATVPHAAAGGPQAAHGRARALLDRIAEVLAAPGSRVCLSAVGEPPARAPLYGARRRVPPPAYRAAVEQARRHIADGDIFQVVLAQGFSVPRAGLDPLDLYRVLRVTNPAPYMFVVPTEEVDLVGASPEVLVRVDAPADGGGVVVRPIAGTRPRGETAERDRALEEELLACPKERAEHAMLVDLARNDIGRVCRPGTVELAAGFTVERYSRVMHIVSEVRGRLAPGRDALAALSAVFPAGTLSGAPKVRALEIADALEAEPRGYYGGAVGYLGYDGAADLAIAIRTAEVHRDEVVVRAGAGIVWDSDPVREDEECTNKAGALLRALALARTLGPAAAEEENRDEIHG